MANKQDKFYFINFIESADYACKASEYLVECFKNYSLDKLKEMNINMHKIEHAADGKKHELTATLAKAFVTPIDREDLALISSNIDEVTDHIEEVLQRFYIHKINTIPQEAIVFAEKIAESCRLMKKMMEEFENYKKSKTIHEMIIGLNNIEEECDKVYLEAMANVRNICTDVLDVVAWHEIYDYLESCSDACEHVGDCIETVIMKNS